MILKPTPEMPSSSS